MNIGLYGATGSNDFGDWAMMVHNINQILLRRKDAKVYIISPNKFNTLNILIHHFEKNTIWDCIRIIDEPKLTYSPEKMIGKKILKYLKVSNYKDKVFREVINENYSHISPGILKIIKSLDVLIYNGGGYIQYNWHDSNIIFLMTCVIAKQNGAKVAFLGNSFGPMLNYMKYLIKTLPYIDNIIVRDGNNYSAKLLDHLGYKKYICGCDDLLFVNDYYPVVECDYEKYIVIEIMNYINKALKGEQYILKQLIDFIDYVTGSQNYNVKIINLDKDDWRGIEYINTIYKNISMPNKCTIHIINENMYQVFSYYKNAAFSLSFKYHPLILSLGSGIPCVGVICDSDGYYESKMKGAFDSCGLKWQGKIVELDSINAKVLIELYNYHITHPDTFAICKDDKERLLTIYNKCLEDYLSLN